MTAHKWVCVHPLKQPFQFNCFRRACTSRVCSLCARVCCIIDASQGDNLRHIVTNNLRHIVTLIVTLQRTNAQPVRQTVGLLFGTEVACLLGVDSNRIKQEY